MSTINQALVQDPRVGPPLTITIDGIVYHVGKPPSIKQWAAIERHEMEQLYGGSKSGGKTREICAKLILMNVLFPGNQTGLFRKDLTDLKGSTLVTFELMCPKALIIQHHRTDHYYLLRTIDPAHPSRLWYGGLGELTDFESAKGKEYGCFAIDEPSEIDMQSYLQMLAQLRWACADGYGTFDPEAQVWRPPYQAILGSNPEPGWLEDHFGHLILVANEECPIVTDGQRVYIQALPKDNPYLPPQWEQVLLSQADIPQSWIDKYLRGSWKASEGLVFKEIEDRVHYIDVPPPEFLKTLSLVYCIDHATTGVTCLLVCGIDPDGNVFALGSYYAKNKLISQHAAAMRDLLDFWAGACGKTEQAKALAVTGDAAHWSTYAYDYGLIDPSTTFKTQQSRNELTSIQDLYIREGIPTVPAWNAIESGIKLMEEYIHIKPSHIHPLFQRVGSPSYFIVKCYNEDGVKELERWKRTITVNKTIKYVGADHWIDCQRYVIMSRPEPPRFTANDLGLLSTHDRKAMNTFDKWQAKFGQAPNANQWIEGGTRSTSNTWFPQRIN